MELGTVSCFMVHSLPSLGFPIDAITRIMVSGGLSWGTFVWKPHIEFKAQGSGLKASFFRFSVLLKLEPLTFLYKEY